VHELIHPVITWYFDVLGQFGLLGVVVLMAMESSIFPVPSELVIPPAAYTEIHAKGGAPHLAVLLILAGTIGCCIGSGLTYWVARVVGRPFIIKYGKYFLVPEAKLKLAEQWVVRYGAMGIFVSRLLPVIRHLNAIPAGIMDLRFRTFLIMTFFGSLLWCTTLTVFGLLMVNEMAVVINSKGDFESAAYQQAFSNLTWATVVMVAVVLGLYVLTLRMKRKPVSEMPDNAIPRDLVASQLPDTNPEM
jgi:membrane protein DedA with SNARE-associated domain